MIAEARGTRRGGSQGSCLAAVTWDTWRMTAPHCRIDHLVVTAPDLGRGVAYLSDLLGVPLQRGGEHALMATHNYLLRLGDAVFVEVIAPDPAAPRPARRRWFALDDLTPATPPRLAAWAAGTGDIRAVVAAASEPVGEITALLRNGLRWDITIPADGSLPLGGAAPMAIQWHGGATAVDRLPDAGCALRGLRLCHPEAPRVAHLLGSIGCDDPRIAVDPLPAGERPYLLADIDTPTGRKQLGGP
jgi:catechol 2,3-dioxygenase-like lactoylglutathione lyase family enzyme